MNRTAMIAAACLLIRTAAFAHHGWAAFDPDTTVTFKGTITAFRFFNPHSVVEFTVKDEKGEIQKWQGELTSAVRLTPKGWTAASLQAGDEVTIAGNPARGGKQIMRVTKLVFAKGSELSIVPGN